MAYAADIPAQLTLPEALNIALTNSTVLREAMAQLDQASGRYLQSRSALLPKWAYSHGRASRPSASRDWESISPAFRRRRKKERLGRSGRWTPVPF